MLKVNVYAIQVIFFNKIYDIFNQIPSCGSTHLYDGSFSGNIIPGHGITAKRLTEEKIKVFSEENLEEIEKYLVELDKN